MDHGKLTLESAVKRIGSAIDSIAVTLDKRCEDDASDSRVKKKVAPVKADECLSIIRVIEPVRYHYVDVRERGSDEVMGFIAQDVRKTVPRAVKVSRGIVPNIYRMGSVIKNLRGRFVLSISYQHVDLSCQRVRLLNYYNQSLDLDVRAGNELFDNMDAFDNFQGSVFVYGTWVDDFHVLHKDALIPPIVGAVRALDSVALELAERSRILEERVEALERRLVDTDAQLARLLPEPPKATSPKSPRKFTLFKGFTDITLSKH